jgi:class 3 adenylate cyclase
MSMPLPPASGLEVARRLSADGRWQEASDAFARLDAGGGLDADGLAEFAVVSWMAGDFGACLELYGRSYRGHLDRGHHTAAAVVALSLAWEHEGRGEEAQSAGWAGRAMTLLEDEPQSVGHAWLTWWRARELIYAGDCVEAVELAEEAARLARRFGDADLEVLTRWYGGRAMIGCGRLDEGFRRIDEAMAAAAGGESSVLVSGAVYCLTVTACQQLADYRRASEWTQSQARWCRERAVPVFPSFCRVNRAAILRVGGEWLEAEREAAAAAEELELIGYRYDAGNAMYELGELHRCRGDLAAAEQSFASACEYGIDALPGLALLRLRQDRLEDARASLDAALGEAAEPLDEARLLPALVEVALAEGDTAAAAAAGDRLSLIAERLMLPAHIARSATAQGRLLLAVADAKAAAAAFRLAARIWLVEVRAPYEAALAQTLLARALSDLGKEHDARLALRSAHAVFSSLGARPDAADAAAALAGLGASHDELARPTARAFLFTDIVSSTALLEAIGDRAWQQLVSWHDAALRAEFAAHRGEEVDHAGDGFFVAFETGFAPSVRMGVHAADVLAGDGAYRGRGVHVAARIASAATTDEILVSLDCLQGDVAGTVGEPRTLVLKGVAEPVEVVSVLWA